jgi:hypothetical protein
MCSDLDAVRQHLLSLAVQEDKRIIDHPNDWKPTEVTNPEDGQPFTDESAWELIIRLREAKHPCRSAPRRGRLGRLPTQ